MKAIALCLSIYCIMTMTCRKTAGESNVQNNNNSCPDFDIIIMGSEQRLGILVKSSIPAYRILGSVVHPGNIDSVVNSFLQGASFSEKSFDEEIERGFKPISPNNSKIIVTGFDCEKKTSSIIERSILRRFLLVYTRMLGRDELNSRLMERVVERVGPIN